VISILVLGFLLGLQHAMEPDHLAAVAALASRARAVGGIVGHAVAWGLGHGSALVVVGAVHGMAGSAALILLATVQLGVPAWQAIGFIVVFGAGTVLGMMALSTAIAVPLMAAERSVRLLPAGLQWASGLAALAVGLRVLGQAAIAAQG